MTTLTDLQRAQVTTWLQDGLQLPEIQSRLGREMGATLTYMELKLLVSELNLVPKDKEPAAAPANLSAPPRPPSQSAQQHAGPTGAPNVPPPLPPLAASNPDGNPVSVTLDKLARPGAMVSGGVTFGDGKRASWFVDETGRLSVAPAEPGYRPTPADMQDFQAALERELARAGF